MSLLSNKLFERE